MGATRNRIDVRKESKKTALMRPRQARIWTRASLQPAFFDVADPLGTARSGSDADYFRFPLPFVFDE